MEQRHLYEVLTEKFQGQAKLVGKPVVPPPAKVEKDLVEESFFFRFKQRPEQRQVIDWVAKAYEEHEAFRQQGLQAVPGAGVLYVVKDDITIKWVVITVEPDHVSFVVNRMK